MSTKFIIFIVIVLGLVVAIFEGAPQKAWQWFQASPLATEIYTITNGHENLSGLLRGPEDAANQVRQTSGGIVEWTNKQRDAQGLGPLHDNALLRKAAEAKIDDMFAQQYFEHKSPDGKNPSDVIKATGYEYVMVGENLALGNFENDEVLVQAWMDSPGHRANILNNKYEEIGAAAKKGMFEGKEVWLAVQEFGMPLSSCNGPSTGTKANIDANKNELAKMQSELQRMKSDIDANRFSSPAEYNAAVAEYNNLVERTNRLSDSTQSLVGDYNDSVNSFNQCLESD